MKIFFKIPAMIVAIFMTFEFATEKTFMTFLIIWLGYALYCLGLLKANEIKNIKNNTKLKHV
jgi:hypothetical protein